MVRLSIEEKQLLDLKKARIIAVHTADPNGRELARELSVPKSTTYRWTTFGDGRDSRGGTGFIKVNEEHKQFMVQLIESNARITLQDIKDRLEAHFCTVLSQINIWEISTF